LEPLSNIQLALTKAIQVSRSSFLPRNKKVSGFKHILYSSLEKIKKRKCLPVYESECGMETFNKSFQK